MNAAFVASKKALLDPEVYAIAKECVYDPEVDEFRADNCGPDLKERLMRLSDRIDDPANFRLSMSGVPR